MNRRHKAILFATLVLTGCSLLARVDLKEAIGMLMIGAALAWAIGSNTASRFYSKLRTISNAFYLWTRPLLAMFLSGSLLGAVLLLSRANPVAAIAVMSVAGMLVAPLASFPTQKTWLRVLLVLLGSPAFLLGVGVAIELDKSAEQYGERFGQLAVTGLVVFLVGLWWLSKGWTLIQKGITVDRGSEPIPPAPAEKSAVGQYVSLYLGITILTMWLGMLTWLASSNWAYAPQKPQPSKPNENLLMQAGFIVLLARWPYSAWKTILSREPNSQPNYLRRHKRTAALAWAMFTVVLCGAVTFGIQNGNDRFIVNEIEKTAADLKEAGMRIGNLKQLDLKTTADYIDAYSQIERLLPEFDSKADKLADLYREAEKRDKSRGPINIQRFYKTPPAEALKSHAEALELLRQVSALTKRETLTARNMAALPEREQGQFWEEEFRPLLEQEDTLREKMLALQQKIQGPKDAR